jgi:hypothetical protein
MDYKAQVCQWLDQLRAGTLEEADLQRALDKLESESSNGIKPQRLLYLQTSTTSTSAEVIGMSMVENGQVHEGPDDVDEWPYNSVIEAMSDGWRVIKFPELALLLQEDKTIGLGCEFILEK